LTAVTSSGADPWTGSTMSSAGELAAQPEGAGEVLGLGVARQIQHLVGLDI
jgi:hypothetical protein